MHEFEFEMQKIMSTASAKKWRSYISTSIALNNKLKENVFEKRTLEHTSCLEQSKQSIRLKMPAVYK